MNRLTEKQIETFKPTYLYIKQHATTGLLYFGKTYNNPLKYNGSGTYWVRHYNKHGKNIKTLWSKLFCNPYDLFDFATFFSEYFSIVKSKLWANLIIENGFTGGALDKQHYLNQSKSRSGVKRNKEIGEKVSISLSGRTLTEEHKRNLSEAKINKKNSTT